MLNFLNKLISPSRQEWRVMEARADIRDLCTGGARSYLDGWRDSLNRGAAVKLAQ